MQRLKLSRKGLFSQCTHKSHRPPVFPPSPSPLPPCASASLSTWVKRACKSEMLAVSEQRRLPFVLHPASTTTILCDCFGCCCWAFPTIAELPASTLWFFSTPFIRFTLVISCPTSLPPFSSSCALCPLGASCTLSRGKKPFPRIFCHIHIIIISVLVLQGLEWTPCPFPQRFSHHTGMLPLAPTSSALSALTRALPALRRGAVLSRTRYPAGWSTARGRVCGR